MAKSTARKCPGCGKVKTYRADQINCSAACTRRSNKQVDAPIRDSLEVSGNSATVTKLVERSIRTLPDLIKVCQIDQSEWEVERWLCNKWEVGANIADVMTVTPLFQVKVWLRRKTGLITVRQEIADLKQASLKTLSAKPFAVIKRGKSSGHTLEISIPDLHVGKLAWAKETGWDNYDIKLAGQVFEDALAALIQRTANYKFDRIIFPIGNDLLHADNQQATTTAGTPQDTDGRFEKSFTTARELMVKAILRLREIAPVYVKVVRGNHDTLATWCLGDSLEMRFHNCPDVHIDNEPTPRKYMAFGSVLLMFTHGNRGKLSDYPLVMATEQPKLFGAALHREAHTGDKHRFKVEEYHGVRVRISPALCPPDAWHSENHYVGSSRSAEAFIWHDDEGLIGTAVYTVPGTDRSVKKTA